jgi:hypothetical protein
VYSDRTGRYSLTVDNDGNGPESFNRDGNGPLHTMTSGPRMDKV